MSGNLGPATQIQLLLASAFSGVGSSLVRTLGTLFLTISNFYSMQGRQQPTPKFLAVFKILCVLFFKGLK